MTVAEKEYLLTGKRIDEFNFKRYRKLKTDALCLECGGDILEECSKYFILRWGTNIIEELPPEAKAEFPRLMQEHRAKMHEREQKALVKESELAVSCRNGVNISAAQRAIEDKVKAERDAKKKAEMAHQLGIIAAAQVPSVPPQIIYLQAPASTPNKSKKTKKTVLKPLEVDEQQPEV